MFSRQQPPSSLPTLPLIDSLASHPLHLPSPRYKGKIPCKETPWGHCSLSHPSQSLWFVRAECIIKFILKRKRKFLIPSKVKRSHHFKIIFGSINSLPNPNAPNKRSLFLSSTHHCLALYKREDPREMDC